MSKVYRGYELLKAIADGEIENGTKIEIKGRFSGDLIGSYFIYNEGTLYFPIYKPNGAEYCDDMKLSDVINWKFKLIEKNETIDIDSIEKLDMITEKDDNLLRNIVDNQNLILKWAKQADKEIKELKSLDIEISEKDINEAIKKAREQLNKEIKSIKEKI